MSQYKDFDYWKRRIKANAAPLPTGDLKMLLGVLIDTVEDLQNELESVRSQRAAKPAKKLGTKGDSPSNS